MHKNIRSIFASNEAVSFGVVKPLHCTLQTIHIRPLGTYVSLPRTCLVICCNCASGEGACQGLPSEEGLSIRLERVSLMAQPEQAANRFSIADCPAHHPTNGVLQGNQALLDHLV